jgi:catechol 2,3-dioxygenase-like lactoylglutathione lyase family enzyme
MIKIKLCSLFVSDQSKALEFYTRTLGFVKKTDVPAGEYRWLTVGTGTDDFELLLEPNVHPVAKTYQKGIFDEGIPATMFFVDDVDAEYKRLKDAGVRFKSEPVDMGNVKIAVMNDTCGNWISLAQMK